LKFFLESFLFLFVLIKIIYSSVPMEGSNPYDENTPEEINSEDIFKDEKGDVGSGNLNAITLYAYPTTFLVQYFLLLFPIFIA